MVQAEELVVQPDQQRMVERAGLEFALDTIVDAERIDLGGRLEAEAIEQIVRRGRRRRNRERQARIIIAVGIRAVLMLVEMAVAQVLAELPTAIELVLQLVAEHLLHIGAGIDCRFAEERLAIDLAERRIDDRTDIGQEAAAGMDLIKAL
ncbi:hypothetical protein D9M70_457830 [compost metagenome]